MPRIRAPITFTPYLTGGRKTAPIQGIALRHGLVLHRGVPDHDPPWKWTKKSKTGWRVSDPQSGCCLIFMAKTPQDAVQQLRARAKHLSRQHHVPWPRLLAYQRAIAAIAQQERLRLEATGKIISCWEWDDLMVAARQQVPPLYTVLDEDDGYCD